MKPSELIAKDLAGAFGCWEWEEFAGWTIVYLANHGDRWDLRIPPEVIPEAYYTHFHEAGGVIAFCGFVGQWFTTDQRVTEDFIARCKA